MIRINLLPVKTSRKQEAGRQQLILFVLAIAVTLGGNAYAWQVRSAEQSRLQAQVNRTQAQIKELDKVIAEVKDINSKETELNTKLDALKTLKKNRAGPVKVLDALQSAVPKKVWLAKLSEKGGAMELSGKAISQDDLAEFMSALQNIVDTPDGIGRLVAGDNGGESRVEVSTGKIESFKVDKVTPFFTNVQLKADKEAGGLVDFSLSLSANYSA